MTRFVLNDQEQWYFINGPWARGSDGIFQPTVKPEDDDGLGIQGYRFAFCKASGFRDLQASFRVQLRGHTDAGLILRATDPQHFYLLHFPDCGQASRAQNFWVALSKMDDVSPIYVPSSVRLMPMFDLLPIFGPDGVRIFPCHTAWAMAEGRGLAEARGRCPSFAKATGVRLSKLLCGRRWL